MQYQTKRLWRKLLDNTWETQQNVAEAFEAGLTGMGLLDSAVDGGGESDSDDGSDVFRNNYVVTGQLNGGHRIDYVRGVLSEVFNSLMYPLTRVLFSLPLDATRKRN